MSGLQNSENTGGTLPADEPAAIPAAAPVTASATAPAATPVTTPVTAPAAAHSKCFGPSSSHSWIHCPFSVVARSKLPDKSSVYAEAGTLAHELCALKLSLYFKKITADEFDAELARIQSNELYSPEMLSNSDAYLEAVKAIHHSDFEFPPIVYIEQQVRYEDICGEDGFGTSDCIILGGNTLAVIDYKNGSGVFVSAKNNPQMRLYAYGALQSIVTPGLYNIEKIVMCIVQPNLDYVGREEITVQELTDWVNDTVRPAVQKIQDGCKDRVPGSWCKANFCPNFAQCSAWRGKFAAVYADFETDYSAKDTDDLTLDELGDLYTKIAELKDWMEKVTKKVEYNLTHNQPVKGWKLVPGRSNRIFTDADKAYDELSKATGLDRGMFIKQTPLTITDASKLVGKKVFDTVCGPYLEKKPGKPVVVPESDTRQPVNQGAAADFADVASPAPTPAPAPAPASNADSFPNELDSGTKS